MDSAFSLINKNNKPLLTGLCLIFISFYLNNAIAGGGDYDPNEDMSLSLIYDPVNHKPVPIKVFASKLFPRVERSENDNFSTFQDTINTIIKESGRKLKFTFTQDSLNGSPFNRTGDTITIADPFSKEKYEFSWGTCQKARHTSIKFIEAISIDKKLDDDTFTYLIVKRLEALQACNISDSTKLSILNDDTVTTPYNDYLSGLTHLNQSNYAKALPFFKKLAKPNPEWFSDENNWLTETSSYLIGRMTLLESQREWDGWFDDDEDNQINDQLALKSIDFFDQYLMRYPTGKYVLSAIGLKRRAYYLAGDIDAYRDQFIPTLEAGIERLAKTDSPNQNDVDLVRELIIEFNNRSTSYEEYEDEEILENLYEIISTNIAKNKSSKNTFIEKTFEELNSFNSVLNEYFNGELQERDLSNFEKTRLFELYLNVYVRHWLETKQYKTLIENTKKYKDVFHYDSDPDILIAEALISSGGLEALFDYKGFNNQFVVNNHINQNCDLNSLEKIAFDASLAATNLTRHNSVIKSLSEFYLLTENFDQLNKLFTAYEDDSKFGIYAAIRTATNMVASKSNFGKGYMNIGYLMASNSIGSYYASSFDSRTVKNCDEIAGIKPTKFNDAFYYFNKALTTLDANDQDRAKTYHFLVYCDHGLYCDSTYETERKRSRYWFKKLHKEFKNSKWADKTPYYYD